MTKQEYYGNERTAECVDNYLRELASTPKTKNTPKKFRLFISLARNIIFNSGAYDFVYKCDALDNLVRKEIKYVHGKSNKRKSRVLAKR